MARRYPVYVDDVEVGYFEIPEFPWQIGLPVCLGLAFLLLWWWR